MYPSTVTIGSVTYFQVSYGPFHVVSLSPVTAAALDLANPDLWATVGPLIDPKELGNDYAQVVRVIRSWMALESFLMGTDWMVTPESIAMRIYLSDVPVIIPLWDDSIR